jgi:hypothetical protein
MTDRYFGIAESKLAAIRPKHSVLEDIVPNLDQLFSGRRGSDAPRCSIPTCTSAGPALLEPGAVEALLVDLARGLPVTPDGHLRRVQDISRPTLAVDRHEL